MSRIDLSPVNASEYQSRRARMIHKMQQAESSLYLVAGGANMEYFFGYHHQSHDRLVLIGLTISDDTFLICPSFETTLLTEQISVDIDKVYTWREFEDPYKICSDIIVLSTKGNVLIDENMPYWQYGRIADYCPQISFRNAKSITSYLRSIKSEYEIQCIRRANEISLRVHEKAFQHLKPGLKMTELQTIYRELHLQAGCTEPWGGGQFDVYSSYIHGTTNDLELEEGMLILADAGAKYNGYFSDVSRTICFGVPKKEYLEAWQIAHESQLAGMTALIPGNRAEEVDLSIRKVLESNNYTPSYTYLPHRVGHGIGLEIHEAPFLVQGEQKILEPGMVVAFDGAFYIEGKFGIRLEDNFLITETGYELMGNKLAHALDKPFGS